MEISEALSLLNGKARHKHMHKKLEKLKKSYYAMSLHTLGACPRYKIRGAWIEPAGYIDEEYQRLFEYTLLTRHERESEYTSNFRFSQYRAMTKAPFARVTEMVTGAIFQDGNYTLEIPNDKDSDYIWGNNFHGYNLIGYFANIGYKNMVEDANGVFVRIPKYKWDEQPDGGVEVEIWFIGVKDIKWIDKREIIFLKDGYAWHIDDKTIFRYKEQDNRTYALEADDASGYYAHMFGRMPISIAGGEWNTQGYYDSYYDKARPAADEFVATFSAAQLVDKEAGYPYITEVAEDCPDCKEHGRSIGKVQIECDTCEGGYDLRPCPTCHGACVLPSDPARRRIVPIEDMSKIKGAVEITTPDTSINKHNRETVDRLMKMILEALVLELIDEAQSGAAKAIDQDRLFKFISKVSNHMFDDLIYESIVDIIAYRNVSPTVDGVRPAVYDFRLVKPSQFQIKTEKDLLEEFKVSRENNLPNLILGEQARALVDKQYSGDAVMKKKTDVSLAIDPIFLDTVDQKLNKRLAGSISIQDMQFSDKLPMILDQLIRERGNDWFIDAEISDIETEVRALFTPAANPIQDNAIANME